MRWTSLRTAALGASLICVSACIPSGTEVAAPAGQAQPAKAQTAASAADLITEWRALAENGEANLGNPRATTIGLELRRQGVEALNPVMDVLADPNSKPGAKALALTTLRTVLDPAMAPRLREMCKPDQDGTTRACATELLGRIPNPDTVAFLKQLQNDPEKRVRIAATIGLLANEDAEVRTHIAELYHQPDNTMQQRGALVLALADFAKPEDTPLLTEAVVDERYDAVTRQILISALGRVGDATAIEPLTKCASAQSLPEATRTLASDAATAIQTRLRGAVPSS